MPSSSPEAIAILIHDQIARAQPHRWAAWLKTTYEVASAGRWPQCADAGNESSGRIRSGRDSDLVLVIG